MTGNQKSVANKLLQKPMLMKGLIDAYQKFKLRVTEFY